MMESSRMTSSRVRCEVVTLQLTAAFTARDARTHVLDVERACVVQDRVGVDVHLILLDHLNHVLKGETNSVTSSRSRDVFEVCE